MVKFYKDNGILLETTCPHTPPQNDIVERKHRRLLETARALRFEANLPKRFWGECVLTATYVINRLPSKVIGNKTPFELLHNQKPDDDFMMTFGCLVNYWNTNTKGDTFEMRGRHGVFLGYPGGKKGYKIYDLESNKIIVSRDGRFHDNHFPFDHSEDVGLQREEAYTNEINDGSVVDGNLGGPTEINSPQREPDLANESNLQHEVSHGTNEHKFLKVQIKITRPKAQ
ncbi:putative RNA-directed DNA polymerase [Helianthus annuus]|nr:putative RNA-directed DNA polymerase [Helianthus annuus]